MNLYPCCRVFSYIKPAHVGEAHGATARAQLPREGAEAREAARGDERSGDGGRAAGNDGQPGPSPDGGVRDARPDSHGVRFDRLWVERQRRIVRAIVLGAVAPSARHEMTERCRHHVFSWSAA